MKKHNGLVVGLMMVDCVSSNLSPSTPKQSSNQYHLQYQEGEEVVLWVNKVGPYHNPQESYKYYSLAFCRPQHKTELKEKSEGLGASLEGNDLVDSGIKIQFRGMSWDRMGWNGMEWNGMECKWVW